MLEFHSSGYRVRYPRGSVLFEEGDLVEWVGLVVDGIVKIVRRRGCCDILLAIRTRGWILGAIPTLAVCPHFGRAVAMTDSTISVMSVRDFNDLIDHDRDLCRWFRRTLAKAGILQFTQQIGLATGDCRSRVESLLATLFHAAGVARSDGSARLAVALTITEIADLVLSSREQTSRIMATLLREGVVQRERDWLILPAHSRLWRDLAWRPA